MNTIEILKGLLKSYTSDSPLDATREFLSALGICHSVSTDDPIRLFDLYAQTVKSPATEIPKSVKSVFSRVETTWFVGEINDDSFAGDGDATPFAVAAAKAVEPKYSGMFVFALRMKEGAPLTRTEAAMLTRGFNRIVAHQPATVFIVEGRGVETRLSIATCERTLYKQDWRPGEKLGRVSILKGIDCSDPHRGHLDILESMDVRKCKTFDALYAQWQKVFSTDVLTKSFYREIQNWYFWALSKDMHVQFPNDLDDDSDDEKYNAENLIRLITRMIFTWFMKEKGLVNEDLFEVEFLEKALKFFNPGAAVSDPSEADTDKKCTYYRAILQNLFFATFNQEVKERGFVETKICDKKRHQIKNFYRNEKLFTEKDPQKIIAYFSKSPFVNGGLFECLDNVIQYDADKKCHEYSWDGFSNSVHFGKGPRKDSLKSALIPDCLFFCEDRVVDLSDFYEKDKAAKKIHVRGLVNIFKDYVFTIEENTPLDEDVALDPELLGKVFENLLGCYNPETRQTARNDSGSFYTPREIVGYMVKSALKAYLVRTCANVSENEIENLLSGETNLNAMPSVKEHAKEILTAIFKAKILDPACGSGAFPMGVLLAMVDILRTVDPQNKHWSEIVLKESLSEAESVADVVDLKEREDLKRQIEYDFKERVDHLDYARKLYVIEHCIFGSDIQPIAVQVSRLRFFITLLCEQTKTDDPAKNYGITPLPNLENNFVAANSLLTLDLSNMRELLKKKASVLKLVKSLKDTRHQLFLPKTSDKKASLKERDRRLCDEIALAVESLYDANVEEKVSLMQKGIMRIDEKLATLSEDDFKNTLKEVVETNLFGEKSVTMQSVKGKGLELQKQKKSLEESIKDLKNSSRKERLLADIKRLVHWNPFAFNTAVDFLDPEWMFGVANGFDIVIGNPPYVQLSANQGLLGNLYQDCGFETFAKTGDIYCLFYERACQMLRKEGSLCFITSNKWMRAGYGESLRKFLAEKTNPRLLIDFAGQKIFESATVDTNILLADNDVPNQGKTLACVSTDACRENLGDFVKQSAAPCAFTSSESWVILNPIELSIKRKMEEVGKPLKDWDVQINYGIKTGCNEAFIINESTHAEILSNCKDAAERKRTEQLIRPILRGRDIKRYAYEWANLYLIATHNGYGRTPRIKIENYPAVKKWLDKGGTAYNGKPFKGYAQIKDRADQGDTPYNLRNCAYMDDFDKPKIVWADLARTGNAFIYDDDGFTMPNTTYLIASHDTSMLKYLIGILNSKAILRYLDWISAKLDETGWRWFKQYVELFPIPPISDKGSGIIDLVNQILDARTKNPEADTSSEEHKIDDVVYHLYGLSTEEIAEVAGS